MNANQPPTSGKQKQSPVQERLKNLLTIESVQKVYVVDEQIAETYPFDDFAGFVVATSEQQLQAIEIGGISFQDRAIALARIEEIWTEWSDEQKREAIATIAVFSNINMATDAQQPNKLKCYLMKTWLLSLLLLNGKPKWKQSLQV
ncbi:MAG: hypothetical protein IPM82_30255 [Saprospiraceae bacterium]|nr:hypothetical protein [Saprospiraceae bacterium]